MQANRQRDRQRDTIEQIPKTKHSDVFVLLHLGSGSCQTSTEASSEDSHSTKSSLWKQVGRQKDRSVASSEAGDVSVKDLKMELALEMTKFIEEIEYQLDHVVPMADLCYVRDVVNGFTHGNGRCQCHMLSHCHTLLSLHVSCCCRWWPCCVSPLSRVNVTCCCHTVTHYCQYMSAAAADDDLAVSVLLYISYLFCILHGVWGFNSCT